MTNKQFRACLKAAGLKQVEFADWTSWRPMTVNTWATGTKPIPQYAQILAALVAKFPEIAEMARNQTMPKA
jgi:hypothetical protein